MEVRIDGYPLTVMAFHSNTTTNSEYLNLTISIVQTNLHNASSVDSSLEELPSLTGKVITGMCLGAINLMTIFGNILVLTAIGINRKLRTVTNYLVLSLAMADLTLGLCVLPFSAIWQVLDKQWIFGSWFCEFWAAADVLCCTASILSLCAISVDRYIGVTRPLSHRRMMSPRRTRLAIVSIWFLSLAISIGPLIGWHDKDPTPGVCSVTTEIGYVIFSTLGSFYIPALVIIIIYIKIYKEAIKQSRFLQTGIKQIKGVSTESPIILRVHSCKARRKTQTTSLEADSAPLMSPTGPQNTKLLDIPHPSTPLPDRKQGQGKDQNNNKSPFKVMQTMANGVSKNIDMATKPREKLKQTSGRELALSAKLIRFNKEKKAAKTLGIVVGIFILCWFPFFFILPFDALCSACEVPTSIFDIVFWLGYCNSMLNPLIYAIWSREFKTTFISILRCRYSMKTKHTSIILTTQSNDTLPRSRACSMRSACSVLHSPSTEVNDVTTTLTPSISMTCIGNGETEP